MFRKPFQTNLSFWAMGPALFAAGALAALGHAPWGAWPLTVVGFVFVFHIWPRAGGVLRRLGLGFCLGAGWFVVSLHWIVYPFFVDAATHGWMAPLGMVFMAGGMALFWMVAAIARRPAGFAAALALAEMARGYVLTGFPWAMPSYVWIDTIVYQAAAWIGPYGVTLAVFLVLAVLGARRMMVAGGGIAVIVVGVWLMPVPFGTTAPDAPKVTLVQPNIPQAQKWDPSYRDTFFNTLLDLSLADPDTDLVVWPETALQVPLGQAGSYLDAVGDALGATPVVLGAVRWEGSQPRNAAIVAVDGQIESLYDKRHLVPFGEYTPLWGFASWMGFDRLTGMPGPGFAAGDSSAAITVPGLGPMRVLICYEGVFPQEVLREGPHPRALVLITNDAWFGPDAGPQQHMIQARARAIETGVPVLRAANTGISAIIDARGAVVAELATGQTGSIVGVLPDAGEKRLYGMLKDWPALLFAVLVMLAPLALRRFVD